MPRSRSQPKSDLSITGPEAAAIGGRIRKIRGAASQREFAGRLGISREQLSRIESGAQVPGTETLRRLAQVARVPLDLIVLGGAADASRAPALEGRGAWEALEPLLGGTGLWLTSAAVTSGRKADRAWPQLSEERRQEIRDLVRRVAVVAVALEALLPARAARAVVDELSTALATLLVERILAAPGRPLS